MSTFKESGNEVKQGRYANAFLYFLMAALLSVSGLLIQAWVSKEKAVAKAYSEGLKRADKKDAECDSIIERRDRRHDAEIAILQREVRELRDSHIAELKEERENSERLATESRRALRTIRAETQKSKQASREIDSVTKSLVP